MHMQETVLNIIHSNKLFGIKVVSFECLKFAANIWYIFLVEKYLIPFPL